ncbi:MAG: archease [Pirellulales bacterium]
MYETFDHTADVGIRVRAPDLQTVLVDAARGLFSLIVSNLDAVRPVRSVRISIAAEDADWLLFDWLAELLVRFDAEQLVLCEFDVALVDDGLTATVRGEQVDFDRHHLEHEVKAITCHGLKVEQTDTGWLAEVIVDI